MKEYHKIVTVFERDPATKYRTLIDGKFAEPEFDYLKNNEWIWTEKVDGTNIRIMWDGDNVKFGGKTDAAQLYAPLVERLQKLFYAGAMANLFTQPACLYGEGYGAKIQKFGASYLPESVDFVLFDVLIGDTWLERNAVEEIANKLEIGTVPIVNTDSLLNAIEYVKTGFNSAWGNFIAEGLVLRPTVELKNRRGNRVITKIKHKDFK